MDTQLAKIDASKKELFRSQDSEMLTSVKAFEVTDVASMNLLADIVVTIKSLKKERDDFYKPYLEQAQKIKRQVEKQRKMIDTDYSAAVAPLEECISIANRKNQAFLAREKRKADEAARQEQARLRKIEEDKRLEEAQRLEEAAREQEKVLPHSGAAAEWRRKVAEILDEPIVTEVVAPVEIAKPSGYSERKYKRARVIDPDILDPQYKTTCSKCGQLAPNMVLLNSMAASKPGNVPAPAGVEFYEDVRPY